jgi:cytosine deaminase
MDLIIHNARLTGQQSHEFMDIGISDGRIVAIQPELVAEAEIYDAEGRLACPGLIESHIHLDKSRIIDRCAPQERRRLNPITIVAPLKKSMTVEDIYGRAKQTLEQCIMHGTTRMRTQVELDPAIGMRGFDAITSLISDYRWAIEIESCVFPQEGLTNYPGTEALLVEGLRRGARVIGGAPRYDADRAGQIERIFALAREFDVDIDMHPDVGDTADAMDIHLVLDLTHKYQRGGHVVVGHMAKLSLLPPDQLATIARRLADGGIAVTVLPATDLFLMGRNQDHSIRRGVADANVLMEYGVNCSLSSNNVLNPATPYGDCSLIRMANLYANVMHIGCGDGLFPRLLAERGASVVGYDRAPRRIADARMGEDAPGGDATFVVATPHTFLHDGRFDAATSVMVLQLATSPEELSAFFRSASRHLEPGGRFISVVLNPLFSAFEQDFAIRRWTKLEGNRVKTEFLDRTSGRVELTVEGHQYQYTSEEYEQAAICGGMKPAAWRKLFATPDAVRQMGASFWQPCHQHQPFALFVTQKA